MKSFVLLAVLFSSLSAQAFSGTLTAGIMENEGKGKTNQSVGLSMSQPLLQGFGWWSWTGVGMVKEKSSEQWAQTVQGIDWTYQRVTVGGRLKFTRDESSDVQTEYGASLKIKLW